MNKGFLLMAPVLLTYASTGLFICLHAGAPHSDVVWFANFIIQLPTLDISNHIFVQAIQNI
jgi:hypothetical protein